MEPRKLILTAALVASTLFSQANDSVLATVKLRASPMQWELEGAQGQPLKVDLTARTQVQRVLPGATNLSDAQPMDAAEVAAGDRVLVTFFPSTTEPRRILVMSAKEIAKRTEAGRQDWETRGVAGIVDQVGANRIGLRARTGASPSVVVTSKTVFRRYSLDSVEYEDSTRGTLSDIKPGDQLRARGGKSADGLIVEAEEVLSGAFTTIGGTVTAIDSTAQTLTLKRLDSGQAMVLRVNNKTKIKRMPEMGGGQPGVPGGGPGGARPPGLPGAVPGGPPGGGSSFPGGAQPDPNQMLERLPAAQFSNFKVGETVFASTAKGQEAAATGFVVVGNAAMLLAMSQAAAPAQPRDQAGVSLGGLSTGFGGIDLGGMIP